MTNIEVDDKTPIYLIYNINVDGFRDYLVKDQTFSTRLTNILNRESISTIADMARLSIADYYGYRGFGKGCHVEIERFFSSLNSNLKVSRKEKKSNGNHIFSVYISQIINGDFSFKDELPEAYIEQVRAYEDAFELVDKELIQQCIDTPDVVTEIVRCLGRYYTQVSECRKMLESIYTVCPERLGNKAEYYLEAYSSNDEIKDKLRVFGGEGASLKEYICDFYHSEWNENTYIVSNFINWCLFNVETEIGEYLSLLKVKEKHYRILKLRSQKNTLETTGKEVGLTRERVRQIEAKVIRAFNAWRRKNRILYKIYADRNGDDVLTPVELSEYFHEDTPLMLYLLKSSNNEGILYDSQLDAFIIGDDSIPERVQSYIDSLPDTFHENHIPSYVKEAVEEYSLPEELIEKAITEDFRKTGNTYHRERLTREKIYADILSKYYPNGMHVYDSKELLRFRQLVTQEYGITVNVTDRAMSAVLSRVGILCGRGSYRYNTGDFISEELAERIATFIDEDDAPIFMTNTIFSVFEDELLSENIDNKYFLQGILHDKYADRWVFRRDYISKDESITSMYTSIVKYVRDSDHPVSKEEINNKFPGVTDIVITISISDPEIINLFGSYVHGNRLRLSPADVEYLRTTLSEFLQKNDVCHCRRIYDKINNDYPSLLKNNYVDYAFSLYSLLEYLFREEFNFSRPFIARTDAPIDKVKDMLKDLVSESDSIEIEEIRAFSKENRLGIYSILEFIDSCNDTHLLINDSTVMRIEMTGISDEVGKMVETEISREVTKTIPIGDIQCVNRFPKVNVQWTEWLIYSVIKKWGTVLEVAPSDGQFKHAVPLIAPKGQMTLENLTPSDLNNNEGIFVADDLDDIDKLIGDYILEEN